MKIIDSVLKVVWQPGPVTATLFILVNGFNWFFLTNNGVSTKQMLIALFLIYLISVLMAGWHLVYSVFQLFRKRWQECRISIQAFMLTLVIQTLGLRIDASLLYIT